MKGKRDQAEALRSNVHSHLAMELQGTENRVTVLLPSPLWYALKQLNNDLEDCFQIPLDPVSSSVRGLKSNFPAMLRATTSSGEVTNACVAGLASFLPVKLRL